VSSGGIERSVQHWRVCKRLGAESLGSHQFLSCSRISWPFMDSSLPCSQKPALIPGVSQMNPVHTTPTYIHKIYFNINVPSSSKTSCSLWLFHQNSVCISFLSHVYYMPFLSHTPWLVHSNIWWRVESMKLLIMLFSPTFCYFIPLGFCFNTTQFAEVEVFSLY
jgi:hypothetical protein